MDPATIEALYRYDSWATESTLDAVARVPQADFIRDLRSSHGSIRDTLTHIAWSEWIWLQRWKGVSPVVMFSPEDFPDVETLRTQFRAITAERAGFLQDLTTDRLVQVIEYTNLKGEVWRYPLWQQLCHVINHSTYHRGQVTTMLRRLDAAPAATDLLVYYDEGGL